ncbi:MAG: 3-dehydroquinate synthase family protein [Candidatus Woesearchaeota archaeon]|nr:3-dehydroquinate synthase family protein [Candidatus Woesearchaeota archaeon]
MKTQNFITLVQQIAQTLRLDYQIAQFGERSYPLFYGNTVLLNLGALLQQQDIRGKALIVSHPELRDLFGDQTEQSLRKSGYTVEWTTFPAGERQKNLATVSRLYDASAKARIDKNSAIIALGGGVVQDITNFLAATYMRGVPFIQIPTTVLSQADTGIGGCAIDHPTGKSLIGQFYQPRLVLMDSSVLKTLPESEVTNGLAEIINKVMCLGGMKTDSINEDIQKIKAGDWGMLSDYIKLSNKIKLGIIEQDETGSRGPRLLLCWGHTITHALEKSLDYSVSHGWALGIGMYGAAILSHQLGYLDRNRVKELRRTIENTGLPTQLPSNIKTDELIKYMTLDQKVEGSKKRFVLLRDFGDAFVSDPISDKQIEDCLTELSR